MSYANWTKTSRRLGALFLDPENPRIPPTPKVLTQPELISELVRHDDVYELASNIKNNGFFPTEPLVAIKENGKLIVVEGNRRLAACKLLVSPALAPTEFQAKFRQLSTNVAPNLFRAIPLVIAPDRDATVPVIIARHTAPQIQKWEPVMQASFYQKLVSAGLSIADVGKKFNLSAAKIRDALRDANLYQMACRLPLPPAVATVVRDPRQFTLTNLSRVFESPVGRQFFGVEFSEDGTVIGKIAQNEFKKGFTKLVSEIATGTADSRTFNSQKEIKDHLDKYSIKEKPDLSKRGAFDSTNFLTSVASTKPAPASVRPRARRHGTSKGLVPRSFVCNLTNRRVREVVEELKTLRVGSFPNSTALAFRCFLELSVYCFLEGKGEIKKMIAEKRADARARNAKLASGKPPLVVPPHWSPSLSEMFARVVDPKATLLSNPQIAKAMSKTVRDEQDLFALNLYAHNPSYHPSETRLRHSWKNFEDFLSAITA